MGDLAIRVENLSKRYRIGAKQEPYRTLRESLASAVARPFRRFSRGGGPEPLQDHIWAVKDVSFEVNQGEAVGIIGPNGAGKTTLLKLLARVTQPTAGRAEIHGRVGSLLEVGIGFHPELTGRENVYLNSAILGIKRREMARKFDEIVGFAGVETFIETPVKHYSSGMYLRLAFAVAAYLEPEILVVDEVLAVGDAEFQKRCIGKMGEIAKTGRTVLFVSHNLLSVEAMCSKAILLKAGQIIAEGNVRDVIDQYLGGRDHGSGVVSWASPEAAPGDHTVRLKAVRIVSDGRPTDEVDIAKDFDLQIEYWNLQANSRRWVSAHLYNAMGVCVFTSGNSPSATLHEDPWFSQPYPVGVFRTTCKVPGYLLNDGLHTVTVIVNGRMVHDNAILVKDAVTFTVKEAAEQRKEYTGPWLGAVRPRLQWQTIRLS